MREGQVFVRMRIGRPKEKTAEKNATLAEEIKGDATLWKIAAKNIA